MDIFDIFRPRDDRALQLPHSRSRPHRQHGPHTAGAVSRWRPGSTSTAPLPRPAPATAPTGRWWAGLLGMKPDDDAAALRLCTRRKRRVCTYTMDEIELRDAHPNTAVIEVRDADGKQLEHAGVASIGGGRIVVNKLDGIDVSFTGMTTTRWWSATRMPAAPWLPSPPSSASCGSTWPT